MRTLKESIQHEVHLFEPKSLEHAFIMTRKVESKYMATRKLVTNNHRVNHAPFPKLKRLNPQQMNERRENGLCLTFDNKYSKGRKCSDKKLFYIDCENED